MKRKLTAATALAVAMTPALLGCTGAPGKTPVTQTATPVTMASARHCPVTIGRPVPSGKPWRKLLFGWQSAHGHGSLWVGGLWPHGIVIITPDDIEPDEPAGDEVRLVPADQRIPHDHRSAAGRAAPPASGQASGYGLTGFDASGVTFPTEGCWQVTGRVGRTALTFVTFVIKGTR